jgi:pimeloyl-ACP methyl ester carboxylesterase
MEILGRYVDIRGMRTYYESIGEGSPIVFMAMAGADGGQYRRVLPYFGERGYRAIALDMPGHGRSYPNLETMHRIDDEQEWVDFVWSFVTRLKLAQPIFVGAAISGSFLLNLASQKGDAIGAVVSIGGNADHRGRLSPLYMDFLNHPQVNSADYQGSSLAGICAPTVSTPTLNEIIWQSARRVEPLAFWSDLHIFDLHNIKDQLAKKPIKAPVLHLRGEFDPVITDEQVKVLKRLIPKATFETLKDVGHFAMIEDPDQLNRTIGAFLDGLNKSSDNRRSSRGAAAARARR